MPFTFAAASRRQARRRDLVAYQAEEPLPIAAEEIVADYVTDGVRVFGVGANRYLVEGLLGELRETGFDVRCLAPEALLAASQLKHESKFIENSWWLRPGGIEQLIVGDAGPSHWRLLPSTADGLASVLTSQRIAGEKIQLHALVKPTNKAFPSNLAPAELIDLPEEDPCTGFIARVAERLVRGETTPSIDLTRGLEAGSAAIRDTLRWDRIAVGASILFLLLAAAAWRGAVAISAENRIAELADFEADLFRKAMPNARVPRGVRTRLESELRQIDGTRADMSAMPEHNNAVARLQSVLASLPTDMRFRVLEVRIESGRVFLLGEARSFGDADQIAARLRRTGLTVAPPSSRQLAEKGIEFRLTAEEPQSEEANRQGRGERKGQS
ncbi:MAG: hypothetical protein AAF266_02205 [Planctomycetota bacterium]